MFSTAAQSVQTKDRLYLFHVLAATSIYYLVNESSSLDCLKLGRWQGPPHVNKVKQYETVSSFEVSLSPVDAQKHELRCSKVWLLPSRFSERGEKVFAWSQTAKLPTARSENPIRCCNSLLTPESKLLRGNAGSSCPNQRLILLFFFMSDMSKLSESLYESDISKQKFSDISL